MPKKPKINKDIREATKAVSEIMRDHLTVIAEDLVKQIMARYKRLPESQNLKAISGLAPRGTQDYKEALKTALSVVALDSLEKVRKEVPTKKGVRLMENVGNIQLAEFDRLPPKLQKKITTTTQLLIGKQVGDLQKVIEFAYATAEDETDSEEQIMADLNDSAIGWLDGTAIEAGAGLNAATIINSARNAFFFDDSVLEEVEAFEFVNGDPVTPICQDLAGTIFAKDDPSADRYFPPLHFNAVLAGTLIETENGPVAIEHLTIGTKVKTHTGQYHPVYDVMDKHEDKEYFDLVLEDGKTLSLTGEHPVLTDRGWVRADELLMTDNVVCLEDVGNK